MLSKIRELIKSEEFRNIIIENNIDYTRVHKNLDEIEDYILLGKSFRNLKTNKVKFLIKKVLEIHQDKNPFEYSSSLEFDVDYAEQSVKLTKNKTHLNCHKESSKKEPINIEKISEMIHRRFKYPNETLKKTLGFFNSQTPYKDCEDYAQDFLLYILKKESKALYMNTSDDELFKLTNSDLRNYLIDVSRSFSKTMIPEPKLGLNLEEWEFFYLIGKGKTLNSKSKTNIKNTFSGKMLLIAKSISEKLNIHTEDYQISTIKKTFKEKFDELEVGMYVAKER